MVLPSTQLQKVSVTLWFRRLQCRCKTSYFVCSYRPALCRGCLHYGLCVCWQTKSNKKQVENVNQIDQAIFPIKILAEIHELPGLWFPPDLRDGAKNQWSFKEKGGELKTHDLQPSLEIAPFITMNAERFLVDLQRVTVEKNGSLKTGVLKAVQAIYSLMLRISEYAIRTASGRFWHWLATIAAFGIEVLA